MYPINNRSGPVTLTLATCTFILEVHQSTLHVEYVSYSIQAVIAIRGSYFFFDSSEAIIAYPRAKVNWEFWREARSQHFRDGQRRLPVAMKVQGIGLETCAVLEKSGHVDRKDLLPSAKAGSKDVSLLRKAARLSSSRALWGALLVDESDAYVWFI
jgi:hypothetical protein